MNHSPSIELACAFPPRLGFNGACTTLADVARHGIRCANPLFVNSKRQAVSLIVSASFERATEHGHGNRANKRIRTLTK